MATDNRSVPASTAGAHPPGGSHQASTPEAGPQEHSSLPARLREAWQRTVGAYATDDRGTAGLLARLVDFGALSAEESRHALQEAQKRIEANRRELDARVDEAVHRFTDSRGLRALDQRISRLESRIAAIETNRGTR